MYKVERFHVDHTHDQEVDIFDNSLAFPVVVYDKDHAACRHFLGCAPNHCGTPQCSKIIADYRQKVANVDRVITRAGFKI